MLGLLIFGFVGLIAGVLAKWALPFTGTDDDSGDYIVMSITGIVGGLLGGMLGNLIARVGLTGVSVWGVIIAALGAVASLRFYWVKTGPHPRIVR